MSLRSFQRALCDLIASPELCNQLYDSPDDTLSSYDLTQRERRRLVSVVRQRGMSVTCTLYRVNRVTPIYTLLPLTSFLLGDEFMPELQLFWLQAGAPDQQFKGEIDRFAEFMRNRLETGELRDPYLREVLEFEVAANALRFLPRRTILADLDLRGEGSPGLPHPLVRVLRFRHEPVSLLEDLVQRRRPDPSAPDGRFFLLLDGRGRELDMWPIEYRVEEGLEHSGSALNPALDVSDEHRRSELDYPQSTASRTEGTKALRAAVSRAQEASGAKGAAGASSAERGRGDERGDP